MTEPVFSLRDYDVTLVVRDPVFNDNGTRTIRVEGARSASEAKRTAWKDYERRCSPLRVVDVEKIEAVESTQP